jgi:type VI secretion system protein ImpJ
VDEYRPVYWGQGAFLTPQHLQQQDAFHSSTVKYMWRRQRSHGWGVRKLVLREGGLAAGTVEVLECELITHDGLVVRGGPQITAANATILPRTLPPAVHAATQPVSLYFAIQRTTMIPNGDARDLVFDGVGTLPPRYALRSEARPDLYDEQARDADLVFVETVVSIVCSLDANFAATSQSGELLKFAEVSPVPPAGVRLSATYIAPSLDIGASPVLVKLLKNLRDLLVNKATEFSAMKRQRGVRSSASGPQDVMRTLILANLSRYVPVLQHLLEELDAHPANVYMLLREIVGELSAFTEKFNFFGARAPGDAGLPPYDHEDLRGRFGAAFALIDAVREIVPGPQTGIRLVYDGKFYKAELPPEIFDNDANRYYIVIDSEVRGEELWARLQKTGKACTMEEMDRLLGSYLFGLKIQLLTVPPEDLPQKGGNLSYFMVDTKDPVWGLVRQRRNLAMRTDLNPEDTVITLVTVKAE